MMRGLCLSLGPDGVASSPAEFEKYLEREVEMLKFVMISTIFTLRSLSSTPPPFDPLEKLDIQILCNSWVCARKIQLSIFWRNLFPVAISKRYGDAWLRLDGLNCILLFSSGSSTNRQILMRQPQALKWRWRKPPCSYSTPSSIHPPPPPPSPWPDIGYRSPLLLILHARCFIYMRVPSSTGI